MRSLQTVYSKRGVSFLMSISIVFILLCSRVEAQGRGRMYFSLKGGAVFGVDFPDRFYRENEQLYLYYDSEGNPAFSKSKSNATLGGALGVIWNLSDPNNANKLQIQYFIELDIFPGITFSEGFESEDYRYFNAATREWITETQRFSQTERKGSLYELNTGLELLPFPKIPLGINIGLGIGMSHLEYVSGTCRVRTVEARLMEDVLNASYEGEGKWVENHFNWNLSFGLKFYFMNRFSLDLNYLMIAFLKGEETNYYYVDTGETVVRPIFPGVGNVLSLGISFYPGKK